MSMRAAQETVKVELNDYSHDRTGAPPQADCSSPEFVVTIKLGVDDISTLWLAAASRLLQGDAMTIEDVIDVIGPEEDPAIAECVTALTVPTFVAGCTMADFEIAETDQQRRAAAQTETPKQGIVVDMLQLRTMLKRSKAPAPKLSELVAAINLSHGDRPYIL